MYLAHEGLGGRDFSYLEDRARRRAAPPPPPASSGDTGGTGNAFLDMTRRLLERASADAQRAREAIAADIEAVERGEERPSYADPTIEVRIGHEVDEPLPVGAPTPPIVGTLPPGGLPPGTPVLQAGAVPGGFADQIAAGPAGDLAERVGIPRRAAPYIIGLALTIGLAQAVKLGGDL